MNDIGSNNNKESVFKVYKDKLTNITGNNSASSSIATNTQPTKATNNISTNATTPSLDNLNKIQTPPINQTNNFSKPLPNFNNPTSQIPPTSLGNNKVRSPLLGSDSKFALKDKGPIIIKSILIIVLTLFIGYFVVNYQAIILKINYYYAVNIKGEKWSELHPVTLQKAKTTSQKLDENYLYIPTLGIQAPIIWGVEESDVNNTLSSGLVNYLASNTPDDAAGNIYITGNTSGPIWSKGAYKTIFTLLNKIKTNDVITIIYKNKIYSYKVTSTESVSNNQVVISPGEDTEDSVLVLLAKYPIGLNWKTYKVNATLYKIESNIIESIDDKVENLPETYTPTEKPIEVTPTTSATAIPATTIPGTDVSPQHFLPSV